MTYHLQWQIFDSYRLTDTELFVRPEGSVKTIDVGSESTLATELARVNRPWGTKLRPLIEEIKRSHPKEAVGIDLDKRRIKALLDFTKQFGCLGQTVLEGKPRKIGRAVFDGDDLVWSLSHAENVDICLSLLILLRDKEWKGLRKLFESQRITGNRMLPTLVPPFYDSLAVPRVAKDARRVELESATRRLIECLLNPNLKGVKRVCDGKQSHFEFIAPIQVIYWRVADLTGSRYLRQCIDCSTVFFATDARQVFCPPPRGIRESRCAKRYRMREARKSKKQGRAE
jgi:hypothetical protein